MVALLVASSGGHLKQLWDLAPRVEPGLSDRVWVTYDTPQSRSLLADEEVIFARYARPRDFKNVVTNIGLAHGLLRSRPFHVVISTGAQIAVSFLPLAAVRGSECHYIESAARVADPSLTGRLMQRLPGLRCYTQYPRGRGGRWLFRGSVFDGFDCIRVGTPNPPKRVLVLLGMIPKYDFRSLIARLRSILDRRVEIIWQTGATSVEGADLPGARPWYSEKALREAARWADVIVSHAGVGSALLALEAGKSPILTPRRHFRHEHVDDHQVQLATELHARGLATSREVQDLTSRDILETMARVVTRRAVPSFRLKSP